METPSKSDLEQIVLSNSIQDRNELLTHLIREGMDFNTAQDAVKTAGIRFRKAAATEWQKAVVELFSSNPNATAEDMADAIEGIVKDHQAHTRKYFLCFSELAQALNGDSEVTTDEI